MFLIGLTTGLPSLGGSAVGWCAYWVLISNIVMVGVLLCSYGSWRSTRTSNDSV